MRAPVEFSLFLGVAVAAHLAIWHGATGTASTGAGSGDGQPVTLNADAALQDLVREWDAAPVATGAPARLSPPAEDVAGETSPAPIQPLAPHPPAPALAATAPRPDIAPTVSTQPPPEPLAATRPTPRPETVGRTPAASVSQKTRRERASPQGGGTAAPASAAKVTAPAAGRAGDPAAMARWGSAILRSIERQKRYPRGSRAEGLVSVALTVTAAGTLSDLRIARSSGHAELDRAAIDAVRRARLPAAPQGSGVQTHPFTLGIRFAR